MHFSSLCSLQAVTAQSGSHHDDKDHVPPSICHLSGKALSSKGPRSCLPRLHYHRPDTGVGSFAYVTCVESEMSWYIIKTLMLSKAEAGTSL